MEFRAAMRAARDAVGARQIFSDPVERDGVTVIPAATVIGGGGGGWGTPPDAEQQAAGRGEGGGGGFGLVGWPSGAYEIRDGHVQWHPAVDVTRIVLAALAAALLVTRWLLRNR